MARRLSGRLLITLLIVSTGPARTRAQDTAQSPAPQFDQPALAPPETPPPPYPAPPAPAPSPQPSAPSTAITAPYQLQPGGSAGAIAGPAPCAPLEDRNGSLLHGDPLLDQSIDCLPGWFTAAEVDIVKPHVNYELSSMVPVAPVGPANRNTPMPALIVMQEVRLPMTTLDWSGAPRVELGYRLPEGFGEFMVTYRSLVSQGSEILPGFDAAGAGLLHSRLDLEMVDLDYASRAYPLGSDWDIKWIVGARFADIFMDAQGDGLVLDQRSSDHFWGIGPHAGLDLQRHLGKSGLALVGKVEMAALFGRVHNGFAETTFDPAAQSPLATGSTFLNSTEAAPTIEVQAGLAWKPWECRRIRFAAGYQFEEWWYIGTADGNHATLSDQGFFLRAEWNY